MNLRASELAKITGGKAEWYGTHRQITAAEAAANVVWDGEANCYKPAPSGKIVKNQAGTYGRVLHGANRACAMTAAECLAEGLTPGPGND